MCSECAAEYQDPLDRRFHAQPVACPTCGPGIWLEKNDSSPVKRRSFPSGDDAIREAQHLLDEGKIVTIKGLGGFHLACDATNANSVVELRRRKLRVDKPFALMMPDIETIERHCFVNYYERELLESRQRPVVLLRRRPESDIAAEVASRQDTLGVMLPYTPLHYILFASGPGVHPSSFIIPPLVMTSGNLSEEPIATDNAEARERLSGLADAFLMHNRDIRTRCDDSVVRVVGYQGLDNQDTDAPDQPIPNTQSPVYFIRRSRGYAPDPIHLPFEVSPVLAVGPELKNTFCLTRGRYAFLSHHIGDMENYETLRSFDDGITHFERLFRIRPETIAYDLHPDYLSTRYALQRAGRENLPTAGVQHHHAHIASCMADNGLTGESPVVGVSFDGTGYGTDGAIWGGEFLLADYRGFERLYHLNYFPLPGGDAAIRRPARTALALLWSLGMEWEDWLAPVKDLCYEERQALRLQLERSLNTTQTSSMGRLFDAAASLAGVRQQVNYEAQAAMEFEAAADPAEAGVYPFEVGAGIVNPAPVIRSIVADVHGGVPIPTISARFHNGVAEMVRQVCNDIRMKTGVISVALSGGVWQNILLLNKTVFYLLSMEHLRVYIHRQVPANDGGVSLGQAVVAATRLRDQL
jgi:hydrogenase maturation protein HypF